MEFVNPKLVINGISTEMDERILRRHFNAFGEIKHVVVYFRKPLLSLLLLILPRLKLPFNTNNILFLVEKWR
ncbi:hypothetical protein Gohar_004427 [Gossypium harknessii]|uniref:RRM domain-containing protein n=1 Tax=Gossypium harknessii TaxID=34285 RepID=A0A7J9H4U0_9ROSI|nr:hypothetical protein [Gossypium harknessii]